MHYRYDEKLNEIIGLISFKFHTLYELWTLSCNIGLILYINITFYFKYFI